MEKGETLTHYAGIGYFTDDNAIYLELDTASGKDYYRIDNEPAMIADYEWDEFLKKRSQAILAEHNLNSKTKVIILETM